jgi:hypothetical protein
VNIVVASVVPDWLFPTVVASVVPCVIPSAVEEREMIVAERPGNAP